MHSLVSDAVRAWVLYKFGGEAWADVLFACEVGAGSEASFKAPRELNEAEATCLVAALKEVLVPRSLKPLHVDVFGPWFHETYLESCEMETPLQGSLVEFLSDLADLHTLLQSVFPAIVASSGGGAARYAYPSYPSFRCVPGDRGDLTVMCVSRDTNIDALFPTMITEVAKKLFHARVRVFVGERGGLARRPSVGARLSCDSVSSNRTNDDDTSDDDDTDMVVFTIIKEGPALQVEKIGTAATTSGAPLSDRRRKSSVSRSSAGQTKQRERSLSEQLSERTAALENERALSERLLLQMLPADAVRDLREGLEVAPKSYANVSIFFSYVKEKREGNHVATSHTNIHTHAPTTYVHTHACHRRAPNTTPQPRCERGLVGMPAVVGKGGRGRMEVFEYRVPD